MAAIISEPKIEVAILDSGVTTEFEIAAFSVGIYAVAVSLEYRQAGEQSGVIKHCREQANSATRLSCQKAIAHRCGGRVAVLFVWRSGEFPDGKHLTWFDHDAMQE